MPIAFWMRCMHVGDLRLLLSTPMARTRWLGDTLV
jgi:hypothetical protein